MISTHLKACCFSLSAAGCGRKAIGIEIEESYCEIARERLEKTPQLDDPTGS
jgi:DNA modification methylase